MRTGGMNVRRQHMIIPKGGLLGWDCINCRAEDRQVVSDVIGIINVNMRDLKSELALRMAAGSV